MLAGLGAASPALAQSPPITLLCSAASNGGTLINGRPQAVARSAMRGTLLHRRDGTRNLRATQGNGGGEAAT